MKNKLLGELVDVYLKTALKVCSLVLVDNSDLCKFIDHCVDLGSILLSCGLVSYVTEIADSVPGCFCIILVMQAVTLTLAGYCGNENPEY